MSDIYQRPAPAHLELGAVLDELAKRDLRCESLKVSAHSVEITGLRQASQPEPPPEVGPIRNRLPRP